MNPLVSNFFVVSLEKEKELCFRKAFPMNTIIIK